MCYVQDKYIAHTTAEGIISYIAFNHETPYSFSRPLADPNNMDVDHTDAPSLVGMILCSATTNTIRTNETITLLPELKMLLEPTIFGTAISGSIPKALKSTLQRVSAHNAAIKTVCELCDPHLSVSEGDVTPVENIGKKNSVDSVYSSKPSPLQQVSDQNIQQKMPQWHPPTPHPQQFSESDKLEIVIPPLQDSLHSSQFVLNTNVTDSDSFSNYETVGQLTSPQNTRNSVTSKGMSSHLPLVKMSDESRQTCHSCASSLCDSTQVCRSYITQNHLPGLHEIYPDPVLLHNLSSVASLCSGQPKLPLPPPKPPPFTQFSPMHHIHVLLNLNLMGYARPMQPLFIPFELTVPYNQCPIFVYPAKSQNFQFL